MTIGGHTLTRLPPDCDPGVGPSPAMRERG